MTYELQGDTNIHSITVDKTPDTKHTLAEGVF